MSTNSVHTVMLPVTLGKEVSIISRREIEPLLLKARQILMHYSEAMSCFVAVLDRNDIPVRSTKFKNQMHFCDFCKKFSTDSSHDKEAAGSSGCSGYFCKKTRCIDHVESAHIYKTEINMCELGLVYWTSPLYRKGRYAGKLIAGQVLSCEPEETITKLKALCKDKTDLEKLQKIIKEIPYKNHEEIRAMARLLGVCAEEISETGEDPGEMIRRMSWQKGEPKNSVGPEDNQCPTAEACQWQGNSEYSLEKERTLMAAFRRGDKETGVKILNELINSIRSAVPLNLEIIRYRAIELIVLFSRASSSPKDSSENLMFESNNRYLKRILESKTVEELIENLHLVVDRMSGKVFSFQGIRHASVLRKAERYIWENYNRKISLEEISKASGLSAPYFSTIFKEEMGENFSSYLNRLRVEKAASLLTETGKSLNEIAKICGFEDQSWFSKIFKLYAGMSPGKYRKNGNGAFDFKLSRNQPGKISAFSEPKVQWLSSISESRFQSGAVNFINKKDES